MESGTPPPEQDTEFITKTVTSSLSMQEYFAQRMARLKKACGAEATAPSVEAEATETSSPAKELSPVNSNDEEEPKKKKKKKNKKPVEDVEVVEEKCIGPSVVVIVDDDNQEEQRSRKKKNKRKTAEHDNNANENCSSTNVLEENCQELCSSRKTKLKKRELLNGQEPRKERRNIKSKIK